MRHKKGSVLVICIWILVILTMLTLSIGHRVSMFLRLGSYQKDRLKAFYLAKAGVSRAIAELINDKTLDYDSPNDNWAGSEETFKKINFDDSEEEFCAVSYDIIDENEGVKTVYGVKDEASKVNINTASKELITALLEKFGIDGASETADNILIWRGDMPDENKIYEELGYEAKSDKFSNIEELTLIKGISPGNFGKIKDSVTTYGGGQININTVSLPVLTIFARGAAKELHIQEDFADSLVDKIIKLRDTSSPFKTKDEIDPILTGNEETNIFNKLMDKISVQSRIFLIESRGHVKNITAAITAVYDRKDGFNLYWHEN